MPRSSWFCHVAAALMSLGIFCGPGLGRLHAQQLEPVRTAEGEAIPILTSRMNVEIPEKSSKVLQFRTKVQRVDGFDPEVVSVTALSSNLIRVHALTQGVTSLSVTDENGSISNVETFVTGDARLLQAVLKRSFPETVVTVTKIGPEAVLLRGWVTEPQQIQQIVDIARLYHPNVLNQMKLGGPQEVQLRVKVMECQRSKIRQFGFNFAISGQQAGFGSTPGNIASLSAITVPFGGPVGADLASGSFRNATMALGIAGNSATFQGLLEALKKEGLLKIQAETTLVTRSGEPARLINGGEFPIPVPQSLGTVTISWKEFGVSLESLPVVISPTRLKQTIVAEVSERDLSTAVTMNGTTVPGLTKRTVETQAEMNFGETLVIGGLIYMRNTSTTSKVPFLGELPGIGAAFRRVSYDQAETELLVMITPEYTAAMPSDQVPPIGPGMSTDTPTDRELIGQGLMEVPISGDGMEYCPAPDVQYQFAPTPSPELSLPPAPPVQPAPAAAPAAVPPAEANRSLPPAADDGPIIPLSSRGVSKRPSGDWTAVAPERSVATRSPANPRQASTRSGRVSTAAFETESDRALSGTIQQTGAAR